jgi:hypothetical protein
LPESRRVFFSLYQRSSQSFTTKGWAVRRSALKELGLGIALRREEALPRCKGRKISPKVSADTPAMTTWKIQWSAYKSKDYLSNPRLVPETASGSRFQQKLD